MNFSKINELKPYDLNCNIFDVYSYDGLSMQELLCQFFTKINECVKTSNETIDLVEWLVNEGLKQEVAIKLTNWLNDGTLENLINVTLFENLNKKIDSVSSQLEHINNKKIYISDLGVNGNRSNNDFEILKNALNNFNYICIDVDVYIKTNETLNLKSNSTIEFINNACIVIDTGYDEVMTKRPFNISGSNNVTLVNFNSKGYKPPTKRGGEDAFLMIQNSNNIKLLGRTKIENANTTFISILDSSNICIDYFEGNQCNADGVFIRRSKNINANEIVINNSGDDGVSISSEILMSSDGAISEQKEKCDNININKIKVNGYSSYHYANTSAGLYVASSNNVKVDTIDVFNRDSVFRSTIGFLEANNKWSTYPCKNIVINNMYGENINGYCVRVDGGVNDSFNDELKSHDLTIKNITLKNIKSRPIYIKSNNNDYYIPGIFTIHNFLVLDSSNSANTTYAYVNNIKKILIDSFSSKNMGFELNSNIDSELISIKYLYVNYLALQNGNKNINIDNIYIENALGTAIECYSNSEANNINSKYININNFNTSNSNYKRGIRLTNTNCEIENLSVINSNISNSAGEVSILYESGNCNIKNINSIWVNETDSNRFNGNIELLNFDKFTYKNGSISKAIVKNRIGLARPTLGLFSGLTFFDKEINKLIIYDGTNWLDCTNGDVV